MCVDELSLIRYIFSPLLNKVSHHTSETRVVRESGDIPPMHTDFLATPVCDVRIKEGVHNMMVV